MAIFTGINMAVAYTREFLVEAFAYRFRPTMKTEAEYQEFKQKMGFDCFDKVGKDKFRILASLDAGAIKKYKEAIK